MTQPFARLRPHEKAHEAIKALDVHMRAENMSRRELARRSKVAERTLADWWYAKGDPHVTMLERALAVFNLKLKVSGK